MHTLINTFFLGQGGDNINKAWCQLSAQIQMRSCLRSCRRLNSALDSPTGSNGSRKPV